MFIVTLTYTAPLERIDAFLEAHRAWLEEQYARGLMLMSGRKEPRTGGVILATGDRETIERKIESDPFKLGGLATYDIIEFLPRIVAKGLERLQQ